MNKVKWMIRIKHKSVVVCIAFMVTFVPLRAQENPIAEFFPEIEILASNNPAEGYYFMGSKGLTAAGASHYIAILDNYGTPVFFRKMQKATSSFRLLKNGKLAYLYGVPRKWYLLDDMLNIDTTIWVQGGYKPNGHDWDFDAKGNLLLMGEAKSYTDMSDLVEGGNTNAEVLDLIVQEFDSNFNVKYTWNSADHFHILDGNENSQYLDFTEDQIDYVHANAISVDSDTSFLISNRHMEEITKVDRRTGEVIWRLGGKNNQFTFINDDIGFSHQHSIRALDNGNILLFDNGNLHTPQVSSTIEYAINETEKTATLVKRYYRNPKVYSNHQGTTQRVHNGNTIINWGPYWPSVTEFHPDGSTALEWDFTKHSFCPRIEKYIWETKVFETDLSEINFDTYQNDTLYQSVWIKNNSVENVSITTLDKHSNYFGITSELPIHIAPGDSAETMLWYQAEELETGMVWDVLTLASDSEDQRIARQIKVSGNKEDSVSPVAKLKSGSSDIPVNEKIEVEYSEPVSVYGRELTYMNLDSFVTLTNIDTQENISCYVNVSTDKKIISILPEKELEKATGYKLIIEGLSDYSGNSAGRFEALFSTITGLGKEMQHEKSVLIFPNPVKGKLYVQLMDHQKNATFFIYNSTGNLVINKTLDDQYQRQEINMSGLKPGIYILKIQSDSGKVTERIIKY